MANNTSTNSSSNFPDRPGELRGKAQIEVQTWQCHRLFYGRKKTESKESIIGLIRFSSLLKPILVGATLDDPYAEMFLQRIDEAMDNATRQIANYNTDITKVLNSASGVSIDVASSIKPMFIDLSFANEYGYRGAYLLADYDSLVRAVLTAKHVGLINKKEGNAVIESAAHNIRSVFTIPSGYKYLAIKRADIHQGLARAEEARKLMGELPEDILNSKGHSDEKQTPNESIDNEDVMLLNPASVTEAAVG